MAGRRRIPSPYPPRVRARHGALHYRWRGPDGRLKETKLCDGLAWTEAAARKYAELTRGDFIGAVPDGTFEQLAQLWMASLAFADLSPRSQTDARAEIAMLNKFFGAMDPAKIQPMHVGQYKERRGRIARVRCNRELTRLRAILAYGLETGWVKFNAAVGILPHKEKPRERLVEAAEMADFQAFCETQGEAARVCFAAMRLAYLTTQRRSQVVGLKLEALTPEGIAFPKVKAGNAVLVRWTEQLRAAVDYAKQVRAVAPLSPYLLPNRHGRCYTESGIKANWNKLQQAWAKAGHARFTFHDTRAMGISKLKEQGRQAREISGHRTEATAERIYDRRKVRKGDAVE